MQDRDTIAAFARQFEVPAGAIPYLSSMVTADEIALVLAGAAGPIDVAGAALALKTSEEAARAALESAYRRGVLDREVDAGTALYSPTNFATRMDYFATYERWEDLPADVRDALDTWNLDRYLERVRPNVERLRAGLPPERAPGNDGVMLLHELDAVIDVAASIAVVPCNCRRIAGKCERPRDVCIQFNATAEDKLARGHGRRITPQEARELVRWADRKGLMHTTDLTWGPGGPSPICNCCADDCYVFRGAARLNTKGVWPRSRYVAVRDPDRCDTCGACARRCHFGAFRIVGTEAPANGGRVQVVAFDKSLCWGCGLCANACPKDAIEMRALPR